MKFIYLTLLLLFSLCSYSSNGILKHVNPFVGTTNFGTTNPGAVCPNGLMSVAPFNVMGSADNKYDKDARWWSTPYDYTNSYFTGFSHVNLSGVGCPDLGSLLLMPTTGELDVDFHNYGSKYKNEKASPGYYSTFLTKYNILCETTATMRTSITRFTFPKGKSHILLNLGEGLTNESGSCMKRVSNNEVEGMKLLGTFCYNPQAVFPIYFVMRVNKVNGELKAGYWKKQPKMHGVEAEWDKDNGKYKLYTNYSKEIAGDDIGAYFNFDTEEGDTVEVQIGVSFVSIANARKNLEAEQQLCDFNVVRSQAEQLWEKDLSRIEVKGGTEEQKIVFYTALYHTLIHPNIIQDVNGQYPKMESNEIGTVNGDRYTVFSLWDTYRNLHQLLTLVYPERQMQMLKSMVAMSKEHGWLPKWELYGRETLTMEGDPSIPVFVDSWLKGLRDFDINEVYKTMWHSATAPGSENLMRPDNDDYLKLGYVPLREQYDNSVSHALEYYIADHSLSVLADSLGYHKQAEQLRKQSLQYKKYYDKEYGTLRPLLTNGKFLTPFDPKQGENFEPCPGFHEGSAWNYTFYVPHDVYGLAKLMGGKKKFIDKLQHVFDAGLYDPANEPDIAYPYLFSYFPDEAWRTQILIPKLLERYFTTKPDGIPGNDDAGTMSAWAVFSMMGFYPDCPGSPTYTLTVPTFDEVRIHLDPRWYSSKELLIETTRTKVDTPNVIKKCRIGGKEQRGYRISHHDLVNSGSLKIDCTSLK